MASSYVKGGAALRRRLAEAAAIAPKALAAAMWEEGERIMAEAKALTPTDVGTLKGSGTVLSPKISGSGRVEVELGFGGAAADYALVQHERFDFQHTVGQAKYLEQPFLEHTARAPRIFATKLGWALKKKLGMKR